MVSVFKHAYCLSSGDPNLVVFPARHCYIGAYLTLHGKRV